MRICSADVLPPRVMWAKSFEITEGQYNAVAYVENPNQTAGAPVLKFTFELLNEGVVVVEHSGTTVLPPNSAYPVFEGKIAVDKNIKITETRLVLEPVDLWLPASVGRDQFRSTDINLTGVDARPRLDVKIENTELRDAEDVEVVATVYNEDGAPATASQTFIERIEARSTKDIVFTWPNSIAKTVKSCEVPTDVAVAIDLSGSMNNDGGNPPQPITDALEAAGQFVGSLQDKDQVAVVTFATKASVVNELTTGHRAVAGSISSLTIDPREESGYTNTVEALLTAKSELNSERHNPNARRVLVLLTDGLPTVAGKEDIVSVAEATALEMSKGSIEIYAIGLGHNVDQEFIQKIASDAGNAYFAPSVADLEKIYAEITSSLCEVGPTKIEVLPKPKPILSHFAESFTSRLVV